ncbi:unnamed protein product [Protopolystoma xenopodis]|uniref:Uncharacterized protein n=1 Tax=Protopolystoma xenopodis TaxID=117903 RepID=A0A3S5CJ56_9PLAT|nr:unnamed protein product [Protopolystoma xenopodis]
MLYRLMGQQITSKRPIIGLQSRSLPDLIGTPNKNQTRSCSGRSPDGFVTTGLQTEEFRLTPPPIRIFSPIPISIPIPISHPFKSGLVNLMPAFLGSSGSPSAGLLVPPSAGQLSICLPHPAGLLPGQPSPLLPGPTSETRPSSLALPMASGGLFSVPPTDEHHHYSLPPFSMPCHYHNHSPTSANSISLDASMSISCSTTSGDSNHNHLLHQQPYNSNMGNMPNPAALQACGTLVGAKTHSSLLRVPVFSDSVVCPTGAPTDSSATVGLATGNGNSGTFAFCPGVTGLLAPRATGRPELPGWTARRLQAGAGNLEPDERQPPLADGLIPGLFGLLPLGQPGSSVVVGAGGDEAGLMPVPLSSGPALATGYLGRGGLPGEMAIQFNSALPQLACLYSGAQFAPINGFYKPALTVPSSALGPTDTSHEPCSGLASAGPATGTVGLLTPGQTEAATLCVGLHLSAAHLGSTKPPMMYAAPSLLTSLRLA